MFMFIAYPWPVASANAEMTWRQPPRDDAKSHCDAIECTVEHRARDLEETVGWTGLRFQWYRLCLAIGDIRRRFRS